MGFDTSNSKIGPQITEMHAERGPMLRDMGL